ncbi:MAG: phosphohydrolase, partial [Thomasclavelia sp.]
DLCDRFLNRKLFAYRDLNNEEEKIKIINEFAKSETAVRYYVVSDDQSQIPYLYYDNNEVNAIEILVNHELKLLPEVSEIVGAITNSSKNKIDHKIFYPE